MENIINKIMRGFGRQVVEVRMRDPKLRRDANPVADEFEKALQLELNEETALKNVAENVRVQCDISLPNSVEEEKPAPKSRSSSHKGGEITLFQRPDGMSLEDFASYCLQPRMTQKILNKIANSK